MAVAMESTSCSTVVTLSPSLYLNKIEKAIKILGAYWLNFMDFFVVISNNKIICFMLGKN